MISIEHAIQQLAEALNGGPAANLAASALVEADAFRIPRFGIAMLDEWTAEATPPPPINRTCPVGWIDCSANFAPLAVAEATLAAGEIARQFGVAALFLRGVKGFGRLAPFVRHLADAGLLGIAGAEGPPFVAPHGGSHPVIGTNPLALALGTGSSQVVIDVASSTATMADIRAARASGAPLGERVALDREGRPTTIAADVAALLPRGGQVGSLLGLVVELMAGVAGGGRGDPKGRGVFVIAIDPARAGEAFDWRQTLSNLQADWTDAGGHWPRGGSASATPHLDAAFKERLAAQLSRVSGR